LPIVQKGTRRFDRAFGFILFINLQMRDEKIWYQLPIAESTFFDCPKAWIPFFTHSKSKTPPLPPPSGCFALLLKNLTLNFENDDSGVAVQMLFR
jgi:hypothetical protein